MNLCHSCAHAVTSSRIPEGFIACALAESYVYRPGQWSCQFQPSQWSART